MLCDDCHLGSPAGVLAAASVYTILIVKRNLREREAGKETGEKREREVGKETDGRTERGGEREVNLFLPGLFGPSRGVTFSQGTVSRF